jgi:asparagine synthase (glutamine-hydrolysing)
MRPRNAGESHLERFLDFDQRYSMPDGILYKVDRMSMAHAVEVRPPFLDPRIVAFAARLPQRFKISGLETKVALRRLMRDSLPADVLNRPKIGFDIPIHEWFRGVLRPLLMSTLNEYSIEQSGLFHWAAVRRLIDEHLDRKANWGYHLWGLVTLILWMRRWNIEAPASSALVFAAQSEALVVEPALEWQPAAYSARTSASPLN